MELTLVWLLWSGYLTLQIISATIITSIQVIPDSSSSVVVTWNAVLNPNDVNTVQYVEISYRQEYDADDVWTYVGNVNIQNGLQTIQHLVYPYAITCVRVIPYDANAKAFVKDPISEACNRTFGEAPSMEPQRFTATCEVLSNNHNEREATFHWQPVPSRYQNGIILGYKLEISSLKRFDCQDECFCIYNMDANETSLHLPGGLSTKMTHTASLIAYNSYGESPPTIYKLQPISTTPPSDRLNTLVFIALVISGVLYGAWWFLHDRKADVMTDKTDLYKDASVARKNRQRRVGVTKKSPSPGNNNIARV